MAAAPLFTVVEVGTNREVRLVDDTGQPCAIPTSQAWRDEDHRYNYTDGSIGKSPLIQRHQITLACDWLTDAVRRRLQRMMMDRSRVMFTPGFGEKTVMAWRPVAVDGTTLPSNATWKDLTGQVALTTTGGADQMVWDDWTHQTGQMVEPDAAAVAPALIVETPYGAGQSMQRTVTNRWTPDYPESATDGFSTGNAGWRRWGISASQITLTHVPGGFGVTACPDSIRVTTTDNAATARYLLAQNLWDSTSGDYEGYSFTGSGIMSASFWVKGRFPAGNTASLSTVAKTGGAVVELDSVSLDSDYSTWTKISLNGYSADWSLYVPSVKINLASATGQVADFQISAMTCALAASNFSPRWSEYGVVTTAESVLTESIEKPQSGSATLSFFVPESLDFPYPAYCFMAGLSGSGSTTGTLRVQGVSASQWQVRFYHQSAAYGSAYISPLLAGVHALSVVWGTNTLEIFLDGESIYSATGASIDFCDDSTVYVGNSAYSAWPLIPLTFRLDADQHTDDMASIHAALMDGAALGTITAARGRQYEITAIPSTPRMADGSTYWIGNLVLSQVNYDRDSEDVTTKEM